MARNILPEERFYRIPDCLLKLKAEDLPRFEGFQNVRGIQKSREYIIPPPNAIFNYEHPQYGLADHVWRYYNSKGGLIGAVCRWNTTWNPSKNKYNKFFLPICYFQYCDGTCRWSAGGFPLPRPLYNLDKILANPNAIIGIAEGEKSADAVSYLFQNVIGSTPPHGAESPHLADWSVVEGREVWVFPDFDEAGRKYAKKVMTLCRKHGVGKIHYMHLRGLQNFVIRSNNLVPRKTSIPLGWDIANAIEEGWTRDHVSRLDIIEI